MATFRDDEAARLRAFAAERYGVSGHVLPYRLIDEMLHASVRESAVAYFHKHHIKWWTGPLDTGRPKPTEGEPGQPTGYLTSSQVACVNHLEPARISRDVATRILAGLDEQFVEPLEVDYGFVAYEWIGADNYLGEPGRRTRGANVTSLDGLMRARRDDGAVVLVAIEWKYTENPDPAQKLVSSSGTDRAAIYGPLLGRSDCPISQGCPERLLYEPYYQLMRQTLLAADGRAPRTRGRRLDPHPSSSGREHESAGPDRRSAKARRGDVRGRMEICARGIGTLQPANTDRTARRPRQRRPVGVARVARG